MNTPLSRAAQAILAAFRKRYAETLRPGPFVDCWQGQCLAAAFRAAADQVVPGEPENEDFDSDNHDDKAEWLQWSRFQRAHTRRQLLAIAAELEADHG